MSRLGLRRGNTSSTTEEFQTDLKFADERLTENQTESDVESDASLEDDEIYNGGNLDSSDSEELPESVSFAKSRQTALQKVKEAVQQISSDKLRKKEKRRLMNERNKEAKRKRLETLEQAKLADDILAEVCSQPDNKPVNVKHPEREQSSSDKDSASDHGDSSSDNEVDINTDIIPLDYDRFGGVTVATEKDVSSKQKFLAQSALEFRNNSLYNSNRIQRESAKQRLSKIAKRRARHVFVINT